MLEGFDKTYTFPNTISNAGLYKLAGNAVSVPVVKLIADKLMNIIEDELTNEIDNLNLEEEIIEEIIDLPAVIN